MNHYSLLESKRNSLITRAIGTSIIGTGFLILGTFMPEFIWWARLLICALGGLICSFGYFDLKHIIGLDKHGLTIQDNLILYYNEFEGGKILNISNFETLKIYKRKINAYLLEFSANKKEETINIEGLHKDDIKEIIVIIKKNNPNLKIED